MDVRPLKLIDFLAIKQLGYPEIIESLIFINGLRKNQFSAQPHLFIELPKKTFINIFPHNGSIERPG